MTGQGFTFTGSRDNSTSRIVAITSVDPAARTAIGVTREKSNVDINCAFPVGGMIVTPAVGEQWYVYRIGMQYALQSKLPGNSKELAVEAVEGHTQVGSTDGTVTLHGNEVQVENKLKLGTTLYRDTDGTLESSTDGGTTWTKIKGGGGGVTSVAKKTGDVTLDIPDITSLVDTLTAKADLVEGKVPDSQIKHRVFEYSSKLKFPATGAANTFYLDTSHKDIYAWLNGKYEIVSVNLDAICENPFFQGLQAFGEGLSPLTQVITGFQSLIDQLWNTLFCGFAGSLNPQIIIEQLGTLLAPLLNNPLLLGLRDFATAMGKTITNLADGAITGATELFRVIFDFLFCRLSPTDLTNITNVIGTFTAGVFNPAAILKLLTDFLTPLQNNPFLLGLKAFAEAMGKTITNLADGAVVGATEMVKVIFGLLTCSLTPTQLTNFQNFIGTALGGLLPADILKFINDIVTGLQNNPFLLGLKAFAEAMGKTVINLADGAVVGATEMVKIVFGLLTCSLTPTQITNFQNFIGTALGGLLPADILKFINDIVTNLQNNPFIMGLKAFAEAMGKSVANMFDGAVTGATELIRIIVSALTCGLTTTQASALGTFITNNLTAGVFNPAALLDLLKNLIKAVTDNPIVQVLQNITTSLSLGGANFIEKLLNGITGIFTWFFKVLKTFLPFVPWQTILPFGSSFWTSVNNTNLGIPLVDNPITSFNPTQAVTDFLRNILGLDTSKIPQLDDNGQLGGIDLIVGVNDWVNANIFQPLVKTILTATGVDLTKLGIDPLKLDTLSLGALGDWASTLLNTLTTIPANLLTGTLPNGMLGTIPVSNIANVSLNLLNQGSFGDSGTIEAADGWSWDGNENAANSSGGSAKTTISSLKTRYLYSKQTIPVAKGDRLAVNAKIKTYGFYASPTNSEPISIAIIPFIGTYAATPEVMGTSAASTSWKTIGRTADTFFEVTNPTWTSVIVRLGVDSRATGGTVWWDDISVNKVGLLVQNNVNKLVDAWNGVIGGLTGTASFANTFDGANILELLLAAKAARDRADEGVGAAATAQNTAGAAAGVASGAVSTANGAVSTANGADGKAQGTIDNIYQAFSGAGTTDNNVSVVKTWLQNLNFNLWNQYSLGTTIKDSATPVVNYLSQGYNNTSGTSYTSADARAMTDAIRKAAADLSSQVTKLTTNNGAVTYSGNSASVSFSDANITTITGAGFNSIPFGGGSATISNGSAVISGSVNPSGSKLVYTSKLATQNYQKVGVVVSGFDGGKFYILGRMNSNATNYIYASFYGATVEVGYNIGAGDFYLKRKTYTGGYWNVSYWPGNTYWLEIGYEADAGTYRVMQGDTPILVGNDIPTRLLGNYYTGFGGTAYGGTNYQPPTIAGFAFFDNTQPTVYGSGFRVTRTDDYNTKVDFPSSGMFVANTDNVRANPLVFPSGVFPATGTYSTAEFGWNNSTNALTVKVPGWYMVSVSARQFNVTGNGYLFAVGVRKNGSMVAMGADGGPGTFVSSCSVPVYCAKNDVLTPCYINNYSQPVAICGEVNGQSTYFSASFLNNTTPVQP